MSNTIGYIVTNRHGALCLVEYERGVKVLREGNTAHLFLSRVCAKRAIACTREYAKKHALPWEKRDSEGLHASPHTGTMYPCAAWKIWQLDRLREEGE